MLLLVANGPVTCWDRCVASFWAMKESKKRVSVTRVSEESESEFDFDTFSDQSNDEHFTECKIGRLVSRSYMPLVGQG
ncbi:hypothetical protein EVAR_6778_1 [Eumeta japonica]|uniref:Uncharacterized protein n=1 Tax=Eumeta variegata TaxID=151549 RepID=A0A4C1V4J2_EUMVA|nr:hypothetical protein EVAR_6778_1 [Eumeta japonica]